MALRDSKKNINYFSLVGVLVLSISWLLVCQVIFSLVQTSLATKVINSIQSQLRQELDFSNFHFISRSITDFTQTKSIKCATVKQIYPSEVAILNLRYMADFCMSTNDYFLQGKPISIELKTLNGDIYLFEFISNNPSLFYVALWSFRMIGVLFVFVFYYIYLLLQERKRTALLYAEERVNIAHKLAHDIRSPLTALNALTKSIDELSDEKKNFVQSIADRVQSISNDLLKQNTENQKNLVFNLVEVTKRIILEKRLLFKNIYLKTYQEDIYLEQNEIEYSRVLSNILNNSIEATPKDGKIEIDLTKEDKYLKLSISDNGIGIPDKVIKQLMLKNFSFKKIGNGLGLESAKAFAKKCKGKLQLSKNSYNGITITIHLKIS